MHADCLRIGLGMKRSVNHLIFRPIRPLPDPFTRRRAHLLRALRELGRVEAGARRGMSELPIFMFAIKGRSHSSRPIPCPSTAANGAVGQCARPGLLRGRSAPRIRTVRHAAIKVINRIISPLMNEHMPHVNHLYIRLTHAPSTHPTIYNDTGLRTGRTCSR